MKHLFPGFLSLRAIRRASRIITIGGERVTGLKGEVRRLPPTYGDLSVFLSRVVKRTCPSPVVLYTLLNTLRSQDDIHRGMMGHRSHSAAPMDSPSVRYRGRSQSPTGHRSLSPPEHRSIPYSHGYVYTTRYEIYIAGNFPVRSSVSRVASDGCFTWPRACSDSAQDRRPPHPPGRRRNVSYLKSQQP